jgi:hypothetical protein
MLMEKESSKECLRLVTKDRAEDKEAQNEIDILKNHQIIIMHHHHLLLKLIKITCLHHI